MRFSLKNMDYFPRISLRNFQKSVFCTATARRGARPQYIWMFQGLRDKSIGGVSGPEDQAVERYETFDFSKSGVSKKIIFFSSQYVRKIWAIFWTFRLFSKNAQNGILRFFDFFAKKCLYRNFEIFSNFRLFWIFWGNVNFRIFGQNRLKFA